MEYIGLKLHILKYYNQNGHDKTYCNQNIDSEYDNYIRINDINKISLFDYNRLFCSKCFNQLINDKDKIK